MSIELARQVSRAWSVVAGAIGEGESTQMASKVLNIIARLLQTLNITEAMNCTKFKTFSVVHYNKDLSVFFISLKQLL